MPAMLNKAWLGTCNACKRAADEPRRRRLREGAAVGRHRAFLADVRLRPAIELAAEVRHFAGAAVNVDFVHKTQRIEPVQHAERSRLTRCQGRCHHIQQMKKVVRRHLYHIVNARRSDEFAVEAKRALQRTCA